MKIKKTKMKRFNKKDGIIYNDKEFNPIPGLEGYYASKDGEIYSKFRNRIKTIWVNNSGYYIFNRYNKKNRKMTTALVSRSVLMAWREFPNNMSYEEFKKVSKCYECNHHKEKEKLNNNIKNLEWVTSAENLSYGSRNQRQSEKMKGNQNACGKRKTPVETTEGLYIYYVDNEEFIRLIDAAYYMKCSKSTLSTAFKNGQTVCKGFNIRREKLDKRMNVRRTRKEMKEFKSLKNQ